MTPTPETPAENNPGCDCSTCAAGDDRWCCRRCHDLARCAPETPAGELTTAEHMAWDVDPDQWPHTPPFHVFRALMNEDDNTWWRAGSGHGLNAYDAAIERVEELEARVAAAEQRLAAVRALCEEVIAADDLTQWGDHGRSRAARDVRDLLNADPTTGGDTTDAATEGETR